MMGKLTCSLDEIRERFSGANMPRMSGYEAAKNAARSPNKRQRNPGKILCMHHRSRIAPKAYSGYRNCVCIQVWYSATPGSPSRGAQSANSPSPTGL